MTRPFNIAMALMLWLVLVVTMANIPTAHADGLDDPRFYSEDAYDEPPDDRDVERWRERSGIYLKELEPEHKNVRLFHWDGHGVDPQGSNYYYYFDKYPCRYDLGEGCRDKDEWRTIKPTNGGPSAPGSVPEPEIMLMLGIGLLMFVAKRAPGLCKGGKNE